MTEMAQSRASGSPVGRAFWITLDQGANSAFSLLIGFVAASLLSADDFGVFGAMFALYFVVRGVLRALVLVPLQIRSENSQLADHGRVAASMALCLAAVVGVALFLGRELVGDPSTLAILAFSGAVALMLLVDVARFVEIAAGRPTRSLALSLVMFTSSGLLIPLLLTDGTSAASAFGVAGLAAALALVSLGNRDPARAWRRPTQLLPSLRWTTRERDLGLPLLLDFATSAGVAQGAVVLLAAIDVREAGGLRAAHMTAAPLQLLYIALAQFVIVETARVQRTRAAADRVGMAVGVTMGGLGAIFVLGAAIAGNSIASLLGETGPTVDGLIVPSMLVTLTTAPALLASSMMQTRGLAQRAARTRLIAAVPTLAAVVIGAKLDGAKGVLIWTTFAQVAMAPAWWLALRAPSTSAAKTIDGPAPNSVQGTDQSAERRG